MQILNGDSEEILKTLDDNSLDCLITDPPYGMGNTSSKNVEDCLRAWTSGESWTPKGKGFMNKSWDSWVPPPSLWKEVYRVLKPGAHGLVFASSRTQDLMSISLRLAGFEVRDTLMYLYGSGFPKSHNVSLAIDKKFGHPNRGRAIPTASQYQASDVEEKNKLTSNPVEEYQAKCPEAEKWEGWGTALKPAYEPIIMIRKPPEGSIADNVMTWGVGAINIDDTRVQYDNSENIDFTQMHEQKTASYKESGWTGHIAKVGSKIQMHKPKGRFPANVILDEEAALAVDQQSGIQKSGRAGKKSRAWGVAGKGQLSSVEDGVGCKAYGSEGYGDKGGASRFFYTSKASKKEKEAGLQDLEKKNFGTLNGRIDGSLEKTRTPSGKRANHHPTVKPLDLMKYCLRLVCPKDGTVLEPFLGSGSTLCACAVEGVNAIGIELNEEYVEIAKKRIAYWGGQAEEVEVKKKDLEDLPLFKGIL